MSVQINVFCRQYGSITNTMYFQKYLECTVMAKL